MSLIALATRDPALTADVRQALDRRWHDLLQGPSWNSTLGRIKERPVSLLLLDPDVLPPTDATAALVGLRRSFPSVPILLLARRGHARLLFELGRSRVGPLGLVEAEVRPAVLARAVARSLERSAPGMVARALGGIISPREVAVVRGALEVSHRCWSADRLARSFGLSRPALSERIKEEGLPSVGHLMVWARLLHAAHWLPDPGRSGESVSRQLEYANGAVFRRALRNYVGLTPTALVQEGGLRCVVEAFVLRHAAPLVRPRFWVA